VLISQIELEVKLSVSGCLLYPSVARQCYTVVRATSASQWEMAILGVSELRNPWTDRLKIWHTWLRRWDDLVCQIS